MQFEQSLQQFEEQWRSSGPLVTDEQLRAILSIGETDDTEERVRRHNEVYADLMRQYEEMLARSESLANLSGRDPRGHGTSDLTPEQTRKLQEVNERAVAQIRAECEALLKLHQRSGSSQRVSLPKGPRLSI